MLWLLAAAAAAGRAALALSASAPWASDASVEAAALLFRLRGAQHLLDFWRRWARSRCEGRARTATCVMDALEPIVSPLAHRALGAALASRVQAPMVEAWASLVPNATESIAQDACWWMTCGVLHTTADEAIVVASRSDCNSGAQDQLALSHLVRHGPGKLKGLVLVYLDPHSEKLSMCLAQIERTALPGGVGLALRYRPRVDSGSVTETPGVPLQGWGAELMVKSSEYVVVDDRKDFSADDSVDEEEEEETDGLGRDVEKGPSWWLRRHATEPVIELSSKRVKELGLQAAAVVLGSKHPLATLRDVSSSLPSLARALSRVSLSSARNNRATEELMALAPLLDSLSQGALTVNGRPLPVDRPESFFTTIEMICREAFAAARLMEEGALSPVEARQLLQMRPAIPFRLNATLKSALADDDQRDTSAHSRTRMSPLWLADVVTDKHFAEWTTDVNKALRLGAGGESIQWPRANVITLLLAVNPITLQGATVAAHAAKMASRHAPMRIGLVPWCPEAPEDPLHRTSARLAHPRFGCHLAMKTFATSGRRGLLTLLRVLGRAAANITASGASSSEGGLGRSTVGEAAIVDAVNAALAEPASGAKKGKSKQKKKTNAKVTADPSAVEDFIDTLMTEPATEGAVEAAHSWASALNLPRDSMLINGLLLDASKRAFEEDLFHHVNAEAQRLRPILKALTQSSSMEIPDFDWYEAIIQHYGLKGALLLGPYDQHGKQGAMEAAIKSILNRDISGSALASIQLLLESEWARRDERFFPVGGVAACQHSCVRMAGDGPGAALELTAVLDPLSARAQIVAPLLIELRRTLGVALQLILAPRVELDALPLQRFFASAVQLDHTSHSPPTALFEVVRSTQTLTLSLKAPSHWMLVLKSTSDESIDLDNLQLHKYPSGKTTLAAYELQHLLVAGRCTQELTVAEMKREKQRRPSMNVVGGVSHCSGAKIMISRASPTAQLKVTDTLVMGGRTSGYYQLKAAPGQWKLQVPDGSKYKQLSIVSKGRETKIAPNDKGEFAANDLSSLSILSYAGGEAAIKLSAPHGPNMFAHKKDDTIHIFSLASGLLYERFLRIMMLSTRERTPRRLKFWLLGNFLSPQFRKTVNSGQLARALGKDVEVELVQYSWPSWLRIQTEKQRLIWGYKILFLDVLFPQSVDKIIYIDADQIVQGDVAELWDLDLIGAPIGMTPFCQSDPNPDTTGFRFWESGYWKATLVGPYHISALFVVDLSVFRENGYGDVYRETYHQLTADPNSLANLDQDLPNYLQRSVPIYSLPEEWLWCESWCGNSSFQRAKTIDLCNNPLTKEPKLEQARRIGGSRWSYLDQFLDSASKGADISKDEL